MAVAVVAAACWRLRIAAKYVSSVMIEMVGGSGVADLAAVGCRVSGRVWYVVGRFRSACRRRVEV